MGRVTWRFVAIALCAGLCTRPGRTQEAKHADRKVVSKVAPEYPELAKHMHMGGIVKLSVMVESNGTVKSITDLGGSPVFVDSAVAAVRQWKFEARAAETTEVLRITFEPR